MKVMSLGSENYEGLNCSEILEHATMLCSQRAFVCCKLE